MAQILIIDDDRGFREGLAETLRDLGHAVIESASGEAGLLQAKQQVLDLVFLDHRMPGMDGVEVLKRLREGAQMARVPVVLLTAFATSANTIESMKLGAFDHLAKPIKRAQIESILRRALARSNNADTVPRMAQASQDILIGASEPMRQVQKLVGMAAATDTTVLITGETGTGKEMVARALHEASARASKPLVALNCAAIPAELLESELFGHLKGAFTGAVADRPGAFRQAEGGTLLLDEIGDMSVAMQAKILRVLQERRIKPVGASRSLAIDVRVVAATHRDLSTRVRTGEFREDLLYRLNVVPIHLPPLRERTEDIPLLAEHFLEAPAGPPKSLSEAAVGRLVAYAWPGNVRELKNVIERLQVLVRSPLIDAADLAFLAPPAELAEAALDRAQHVELDQRDLPRAIAQLEQAMIRKALSDTKGNRAEAARRLGIHRQLLYAKMKEFGITD